MRLFIAKFFIKVYIKQLIKKVPSCSADLNILLKKIKTVPKKQISTIARVVFYIQEKGFITPVHKEYIAGL